MASPGHNDIWAVHVRDYRTPFEVFVSAAMVGNDGRSLPVVPPRLRRPCRAPGSAPKGRMIEKPRPRKPEQHQLHGSRNNGSHHF